MHDASILVFNLVYAGTLGIGLLMFIGQLAAFIVLLAIAATVEFLVVTLGGIVRRARKPGPQRQLQGRHFSQISPARGYVRRTWNGLGSADRKSSPASYRSGRGHQ